MERYQVNKFAQRFKKMLTHEKINDVLKEKTKVRLIIFIAALNKVLIGDRKNILNIFITDFKDRANKQWVIT